MASSGPAAAVPMVSPRVGGATGAAEPMAPASAEPKRPRQRDQAVSSVMVRDVSLPQLVGELADRGTTVLVTTHDLVGIEGIADRVGIMHHGKLVYDEAMDELKKRFRRLRFIRAEVMEVDEVRAALDPLDVADCRFVGAAVDAVVGLADHARVSAFMEAVGLTDLEIEPLSLEEIFVALCGDENGGEK